MMAPFSPFSSFTGNEAKTRCNAAVSPAVTVAIDYMTIARWVGHKDGGVLIGKVYGHLSNEHAQAQAQRLNFAPKILNADKSATHVQPKDCTTV